MTSQVSRTLPEARRWTIKRVIEFMVPPVF
jgi:hypothetical protein